MIHKEIDWTKFAKLGQRLVGKEYNFGTEVSISESDPGKIQALDCSELVEWLFAQVGVHVPDGSWNQANVCRHIPRNVTRIGDLGFKWDQETQQVHHVGVHLGNDEILEAKGKSYGVVITPINLFESSKSFAFWGRLNVFDD